MMRLNQLHVRRAGNDQRQCRTSICEMRLPASRAVIVAPRRAAVQSLDTPAVEILRIGRRRA
jgi:hypothetical protein